MHTSVKIYDNNYSRNKRSERTNWYCEKRQLQYILQYMQVINSTCFFLEVHLFAS